MPWAIMAVPAHDSRDYEFAKKFGLEIIPVLQGGDITKEAYTEDGIHINSDFLNGMDKAEAIDTMIKWLEEHQIGSKKISYRLREWVFARQRYWGEPIPIVHYKDHDEALRDDELPLVLPELDDYKPKVGGTSPLNNATEWVKYVNDKNEVGYRETNTMPGSAGSSWYFMRYIDPNNDKEFANYELLKHWLPVDLYVGGTEHAVLHLLYARFWHKVLYDLGLVNSKEPFQRLVNQGMITSFAYQRANKTLVPADQVVEQAPDVFVETTTGEKLERVIAKMSKSLKNVINPDDVIREYGADSVRMYEMFMGPLEVSKPWSTQGLIGVNRFLEKIWAISNREIADISLEGDILPELADLRKSYHKTVKKVTADTASLNFNTAISQMMIFISDVSKVKSIPRSIWVGFVKMLACYAPHLGEELWEKLGYNNTIAYEQWPMFDEKFCTDDNKTIVVQVNGKVRDKFDAAVGTSREVLEKTALATEGAKRFMSGKDLVKVIIVPDKLVNIVVK